MRKICRYLEGFDFWDDKKTFWNIGIWLRNAADKEFPVLATTSEHVRARQHVSHSTWY